MTNNLATLIPQLANRRVLVLGDVILDEAEMKRVAAQFAVYGR